IEPVLLASNDEDIDIENLDVNENLEEEDVIENAPIATEQVRKITSLDMSSRKLKIKISKELLEELENLEVEFRLN
ncbi:hypothetical protein, partial [Flavobacterium sp.]|uniref:hypothetical protein n=1 Tax=Flavobacterium sp. TaxID=239 RepID=UPI003751C339